MASEKKNRKGGDEMYFDVAAGVSRKGDAKKLASKYSTKETVNLCIHERKGLPYELFFLLLAAILLVLVVLEFFAAYRPYLQMEADEQRLAEETAAIQQLKDATTDYRDVQAKYRKYNYENFPRERVDRDDIFELVKQVVFDRAIITSFTLRENVLTLQLSGVKDTDLADIPAAFEASELVEGYEMPRAEIKSDLDTMTSSFGITVTFKSAA